VKEIISWNEVLLSKTFVPNRRGKPQTDEQ
jgi:hypothetical protein